jgi:hypothetical protein
MKQCRQDSEFKIIAKNRKIFQGKSAIVLGVITGSNLSWEIDTGRTCSRIGCNLFKIHRLSKILYMNVRRMFYHGLLYCLLAYGIIWGQSAR